MLAHAATQAVRDLETRTQERGIDLAASNLDGISDMLADPRVCSTDEQKKHWLVMTMLAADLIVW